VVQFPKYITEKHMRCANFQYTFGKKKKERQVFLGIKDKEQPSLLLLHTMRGRGHCAARASHEDKAGAPWDASGAALGTRALSPDTSSPSAPMTDVLNPTGRSLPDNRGRLESQVPGSRRLREDTGRTARGTQRSLSWAAASEGRR
jgi:hypothetical protein